jgi:hypothetical protein
MTTSVAFCKNIRHGACDKVRVIEEGYTEFAHMTTSVAFFQKTFDMVHVIR